jgi:hypothetical protein
MGGAQRYPSIQRKQFSAMWNLRMNISTYLVLGKKAEVLINEWSSHVAGLSTDIIKARAVFRNMKTLLSRK